MAAASVSKRGSHLQTSTLIFATVGESRCAGHEHIMFESERNLSREDIMNCIALNCSGFISYSLPSDRCLKAVCGSGLKNEVFVRKREDKREIKKYSKIE